MSISNYPSGFKDGVTIKGVPLTLTNPGEVFFVSNADVLLDKNQSVAGADSPACGTFQRPFRTIDYAIGQCTANRGDVIVVKPGHSETVIADSGIDIDVAGVTIVGMGAGEDRPTVTFTTAATADFKLAAANVTVENILFKAGIDALTGPIEISGDDCSLINCEYRDDATSNYETIDVVVTASTPLRMLIDGFKYVLDGGAGGTQNQSVIQLNGADNAVIRNCWLVADSGTGVIEDATVSDQILIENCVVENSEVSPTVAILLQATTTGTIRNTNIRVASGTTYLTAVNDMQLFEVFGTGTDATTGEKVGTQLAGDIEAKVDVIDGYHDVPTADVTTNSQMRDVIGNKTDAAVQAATTNKSLMAYIKAMVDRTTPQAVLKSTGDLTAFGTSLSLFTVTGDVLAKVAGSVDVAVTSTSGTTTLEVGVTGNTACLCVQDAVDNTAFAIGDSWTLDTAADANGALMSAEWTVIGNGVDVILTGSVDDITAGDIDFHLLWIPLSSDGNVVAA